MIQNVQNLLSRLSSVTSLKIFSLLQKNFGRVFLYGTCITDLYFGLKPNDFDCVVDIKKSSEIENFLKDLKIPYERTMFGGYRFEYDGLKIDLWNLKDTFCISPKDYKIEDLLSLCTLNVQSILYDIVRCQILVSDRWMPAIKRRLLDFVNLKTLYPEKLEKQTTKLKNRYKFGVSYGLQKQINRISKTLPFSERKIEN